MRKNLYQHVRFEVLMGVNMSMVVFWVEIPCEHTGWCYHFGRMLVPTCISTWHHSPEDYHGKRISAFTNLVAQRERERERCLYFCS
jgi:hypothetical protein